MHSGRTMGWAGHIERPPAPRPRQHGRHRKTPSAGAWTPHPRSPRGDEDIPVAQRPPMRGPGDHRAEEVRHRDEVGAQDPVVDPLSLVDTIPAGGLHKFDLGMVPASVTPPKTWRRAGWFAVASSTAALGGLVFASSALVSNSTTVEGLDLPGMPRGTEYPPIPGRDEYFLTSDRAHPEPTRPAGLVESLPRPTGAPEAGQPSSKRRPPRTGSSGDSQGQSGRGPGGSGSTGSGAATTPTAPPTTEQPRLLVFSDTEPIKRRSDQYFSAIRGGDLRGAYAMTSGPLRAEGYDAFASRYAHASAIEVVAVYVTPSSTVTTLRLTRPDGSVQTQRRELRFTSGKDPVIISDDLVD